MTAPKHSAINTVHPSPVTHTETVAGICASAEDLALLTRAGGGEAVLAVGAHVLACLCAFAAVVHGHCRERGHAEGVTSGCTLLLNYIIESAINRSPSMARIEIIQTLADELDLTTVDYNLAHTNLGESLGVEGNGDVVAIAHAQVQGHAIPHSHGQGGRGELPVLRQREYVTHLIVSVAPRSRVGPMGGRVWVDNASHLQAIGVAGDDGALDLDRHN